MGRRPLAAQTPEDGDPSALTLDSGAAFGSAALCARSRAGLSRPEQAGAALHISTRRSGSGFPWRAGERAETSGAPGGGETTHSPAPCPPGAWAPAPTASGAEFRGLVFLLIL